MIPNHILNIDTKYAPELLDVWISKLSDRERFIITERYSGNKPIPRSKIAPRVPRNDGSDKIGIGIDRVRQIENVALAKIRRAIQRNAS